MDSSAAPRRLISAASVLLLALAVLFGVAAYLSHEQSLAREKVHRDYVGSVSLTARLIGDGLTVSETNNRRNASETFAGAPKTIPAALEANHTGLDEIAVLTDQGAVLGSYPSGLRQRATVLRDSRSFALARRSGHLVFGDLVAGNPVGTIDAIQPFDTPYGGRMMVIPLPLQQVTSLGEAYLSSAQGALGGHAYLVDGKETVIASSSAGDVGRTIPADLRSAHVPRVDEQSGRFVVSHGVPASTWRVVFVTPERALLAPLRSSRMVAWQLYAAFVAAMALLLLIGTSALRSSGQLAHARLHDTLTGLPNRALLFQRLERALRERRHSFLAVLFIDLDGFKPINDRYGHSTGDKLLNAVGRRLVESMRPGDQVSRIGGDEFLVVVCADLRGDDAARAVAERIQDYLAQPYTIDDEPLLVGSSIGVATVDLAHSSEADVAEHLIHQADQAMYMVKRRGGRGIEFFSPAHGPQGTVPSRPTTTGTIG